ncbi:uncharacterized protein LOC114717877 isoform X2 [Neltuma alba]|uniref:uncharacterized protein LOC114717877 isoform X2 n=1 Tax=Neltuma alba TaxID=207710 RepID=UPI0010A36F6A|nr:uncharacterized protein LOC114717877 isoform X2 [Prosopis alba]
MTEAIGFDLANLYKAISENNWPAAKEFIDHHPRALNQELEASTGETPLHVAVKFGHLSIVEELVRLVPPEHLQKLDAHGYTPLGIAASHRGIVPIAKCLVDRNSNALSIPNGQLKLIPVTLAFRVGLYEMGRYLYSVTPLQVFKSENGPLGPSFLRGCFVTGDLDVALDLLQRCEELIFAADFGYSTIENIAFYLSDSLNKSQLRFWKQWVYYYIKIPSTMTANHFCVDMQQEDKISNKAEGMKEIHKRKLQHSRATEILNLVCKNLTFLSEDKRPMIAKALLTAAKLGNVEFLFRVSTANPELISMVTFSQRKGHAFFNAVEYRQAEVFNLLRGFHFRNVVAAMFNENHDNLLHTAAKLAPASQLNRIPGAALKMQREWQWFKAVESVVNLGIELRLNKEGLTPLDYFKKNHKELRNEGEKWMKDTASSCSVVGALIVTIVFATAFTVPGGNDQASGYPIFLKEKLFKVFLISDAVSLFASTTSVLTFLGILTSRYAEEDFLYSLPTKLIIGLSTLFLSIATMLIAFSATIIIMWQHNSSPSWVFLPVIMVASVPLSLFVLLQFPLLVEIISSTYGPGIFHKKVKKWP